MSLGVKRLRTVLRERLDLVYGRYRVRRVLSLPAELAERKFYVAWLLAQAMSEGWMVVALDESALQLDMHHTHQWQPRSERAKPGRQTGGGGRNGGIGSAAGGGISGMADSMDGGIGPARVTGQVLPFKKTSLTLLAGITLDDVVAT